MRCYRCAQEVHQQPRLLHYHRQEAIGVCRQCGEAVCGEHGRKSDIPLPGDWEATLPEPHVALHPFLCTDCYAALKALTTGAARPALAT